MKRFNFLIWVLILCFAMPLMAQDTAGDKADPKPWGWRWDKVRQYILYGQYTMHNKLIDTLYVNTDMVLPNDEIIRNSPDGSVFIIADDSLEYLNKLYIQSSLDTPNVVDDMYLSLIFRAEDDSSGTTDWGSVDMKLTDVSDESEDSQLEFKTLTAGSSTTPLSLTGGTVTVTAGVLKHAYDAAAYWTATQADGGSVTFNSVSDGTAGFAFSDNVAITGTLTGQTVYDHWVFHIDSASCHSDDTLWMGYNGTGATVTVDSILAMSDTDDESIDVVHRAWAGGAPTLIDALTVSTDGDDCFTTKETTISSASVANKQQIGLVVGNAAQSQVILHVSYTDAR